MDFHDFCLRSEHKHWHRVVGEALRRGSPTKMMQTHREIIFLLWNIAMLQEGRTFLVYKTERENVCKTEECTTLAKRLKQEMKSSVDPCEDFYEFACGNWKDSAKIPTDMTYMSKFAEATMQMEEKMSRLLESKPLNYGKKQSLEDKMTILFKSCRDTPVARDRDIAEIKNVMKKYNFGSWPSMKRQSRSRHVFTKILKESGWRGLFGITVDVNIFDPAKYTIDMNRPSWPHPLSDQAFRSLSKENEAKYRQYIGLVIETLDSRLRKHKEQLVTSIFDYEEDIAYAAPAASGGATLTSLKEVNKQISPEVDFKDLIKHLFSTSKTKRKLDDSQSVVLWAQAYYKGVVSVIESNEPHDLFNYLGWKFLSLLVKYSRSDLFSYYTSFLQSVDPSYKQPQRPFTSTCIRDLMDNMKYAFGRMYVTNYFKDTEVLKEIEDVTSSLDVALKKMVNKKQWLDDTTKTAALLKVERMLKMIGYPEWITKPSQVEALFIHVPLFKEKEAYVSMMTSIIINNMNINLEKISSTVNKEKEWHRDPADVNGEYIPQTNAIGVFAGLLQKPLYTHNIPVAVTMGTVGWFAGHELIHALDTHGCMYDSTGALKDWRTPEVCLAYQRLSECFSTQYSKIYDPEAEEQLSGVRTLGENIADNGGLRMAAKALKGIVKSTPTTDVKLPGFEKYSASQMFYIAFANAQCNKMLVPAMKYYIEHNPHTIPKYRVNTALQNDKAFSKAFKCAAKTPMNISNKCVFW
uniref:Putative peptidase family m13 includes neprilysin and endothelin-converting enzyme i n=1 Tax=Ixodes ricinus TaxID=34613 RepID=A0A6B0VEF9_IXORI